MPAPTYTLEKDHLSENRMILNFGPQHPATHGTLRIVLELDGEIIVKAIPEIGFLHTGFEKLGEFRSYNQFITLTDRMNYMSALANNIGFAVAVEELMGIEVPARAQILRVILAELTRIADHVISVGLQAMDLGAFSVMLWTFIEREKLYDIFEAVTGARLTTSYTRIGGLARDVPEDFPAMVRNFLEKFPPVLDEVEKMLSTNRIFLNRTKGIGALTKEEAIAYGLTGPLLRASGMQWDLRRERPYSSYEKFDFDVPVLSEGDCFARYEIRMAEMRQSLRIVRQALERIPPGPVIHQDYKIALPSKPDVHTDMESLIHHFKLIMDGHGFNPPVGEVYSATEAPNGELGFYIISDGSRLPYRVRVRPPSFYAYQTITKMIEGRLLSDIVSVLASLNVIAGELDR